MPREQWVGESKRGSLFDGSNPLLGIAALIEEWASRSLFENGTNASFSIQIDRIGTFDSRPSRIYYLYELPIICASLRIVAFISPTHLTCQNSLVDYRKQNATREICREGSSKCHWLASRLPTKIKDFLGCASGFAWLRAWRCDMNRRMHQEMCCILLWYNVTK